MKQDITNATEESRRFLVNDATLLLLLLLLLLSLLRLLYIDGPMYRRGRERPWPARFVKRRGLLGELILVVFELLGA